jgi:hypothetical protein
MPYHTYAGRYTIPHPALPYLRKTVQNGTGLSRCYTTHDPTRLNIVSPNPCKTKRYITCTLPHRTQPHHSSAPHSLTAPMRRLAAEALPTQYFARYYVTLPSLRAIALRFTPAAQNIASLCHRLTRPDLTPPLQNKTKLCKAIALLQTA